MGQTILIDVGVLTNCLPLPRHNPFVGPTLYTKNKFLSTFAHIAAKNRARPTAG